MAAETTDILVYADWQGMPGPKLLGTIRVMQAKGRRTFGFQYDESWLSQEKPLSIDPEIHWYSGWQYPAGKQIFGVFNDSIPDTWGRTLMKRRAAIEAKNEGLPVRKLYETDLLLGVFDETRMGALRFRLDPNGPFLDDNNSMPTPPWLKIRELQAAAESLESDKSNDEIREWLNVLIAPGSSLGGARPKSSIVDENGQLWIAKFPSKYDHSDKAAWEFLAYILATQCGIEMAECRLQKISGKYNTFFTKRFDRIGTERLLFASAMTMTALNEEMLRDASASYLDLVDVICNYGANPNEDLEQLWRRIVFSIAISNTDDHLRNHGFLHTAKGWVLSPAFDINPSADKNGLALNIDTESNAQDFELAKSVGNYFRLSVNEMDAIIAEVVRTVSGWKKLANEIGISRAEQELMEPAFLNLT